MENAITPELTWAILGVVLLVAEVVTGTFLLLFLGISGLLVSLVTWVGLKGTPQQILAFAFFSALGILFFRKKVRQVLERGQKYAVDEHQTLILSETIGAQAAGKVQYQGSPWTAYNESNQTLEAGSKVVILRTEGVKLIIGPTEK